MAPWVYHSYTPNNFWAVANFDFARKSPTAVSPLWWCVCCALFAVRRADFILDKRQDEATGSVYGVVQDDVTQVRFLLRVGPGSDDGVIVGGQFMEPDLADEVRAWC